MPELNRRAVTQGLLGTAAAGSLIAPAAAAGLIVTPRQSEGPFYPERIPLDHDNDLVTVEGQSSPPDGQVTHVFGRVLGRDGRPMVGARVEIWQCDAAGHYHHSGDGGRADPRFQGYGRSVTGADGGYRFRTIKPARYTGRPPHIHFIVSGPGIQPLTTQMYVKGDPQNDRDYLLGRVREKAARDSLIVALAPAGAPEPGTLAGRFDIVLGQTPPA